MFGGEIGGREAPVRGDVAGDRSAGHAWQCCGDQAGGRQIVQVEDLFGLGDRASCRPAGRLRGRGLASSINALVGQPFVPVGGEAVRWLMQPLEHSVVANSWTTPPPVG